MKIPASSPLIAHPARPAAELRSERDTDESGQAAISTIVILGLFLIAVFGFAVDLTNIWFHRQAAVAASDAACQAGAMDMLATSNGLTPPAAGFTVGQASNCVSESSATMCTYASLNGYNGTGIVANTASNSVAWTFPQTVSGVTASGTNSFLQVNIVENVKSYFVALLSTSHVQTIAVSTTCGITQVKEAAPMMVLSPTASGAFTYSGGGTLNIVGGPQRGLQVNSSSATAVSWSASGSINLSAGGPNQTGSDAAIVGGPTTIPTNGSSVGYTGGSTGNWKSNVLPVQDPFGSLPVPAKPAAAPAGKWVQYGVDGCPDQYNNVYVSQSQPNESCYEFEPGYYASGMNISTLLNGNNYATIIFAPGIYYLNGSLTSGGSLTLRPAKPAGWTQTSGAMFYFLGTGSIAISGGASSHTIDPVALTDLTCDGSTPSASLGLPAKGLTGNVLIAPCTTNGTYVQAGVTNDTVGNPGVRGLLLFQDHADTTQPSFTASGTLGFSGALYFHSSSYSDVLTLSGAGTSGTFVLGEIVTDQVSLTGSGTINLALNPQATTSVSKVAVFQ